MLNHTSSALSDLINETPGQRQTLVTLLRYRKLASGAVLREVGENLGDEITTCINGEELPGQMNCTGLPISKAEAPTVAKDALYFQFLFLSSWRNETSLVPQGFPKGLEANNQQDSTTNQVNITKGTLLEICNKLGVSLKFLDGVLKPSIWSKQSCGCFHTWDDNGKVEAINGFYHYFNEWDLSPLHTWFQYQVKTKCTTYLLFDCPQGVKEKLFAADFFPQPLSVDLLLAEVNAQWREQIIDEHYQSIFNWHEKNGTMNPPLNRHINAIDSMPILTQLSRTWNIIYEDLGDLEERLDFLLSVSEKLSAVGIQTRTVAEHLTFVRSRNHLRRRWVTSFGERTKYIINFVFAEQAQNETSSMMTIATVTMLFLPGAFVAAVMQVSNKLGQFFTFTIPATILVLVAYQIWRRAQERREMWKKIVQMWAAQSPEEKVGIV